MSTLAIVCAILFVGFSIQFRDGREDRLMGVACLIFLWAALGYAWAAA